MLTRGLTRRLTRGLTGGEPAEGPQDSPAELLRAGGQDAAIAGVILTLVLVAVMARLLAGPGMGPLGVPVLLGMTGTFLTSATFAVRTRLTLLRALGEVRARIGAPLDPGVPWLPTGSHAAIGEQEMRRELRRLVGAAYRCHDLSLNALVWALATIPLLVVWLLL
ncbi:hypothetical protein SAMN04489712_10845 [Thermomonospora echinospora]|uniref:Uncharacterized protein n=1 Tax=Thermomonospora echinospora TaxID=1992 RepID=A0A1H6BVI7_9ACTN|nr:hypothetical protein [Thermomonospora echinospora]SEG64673.1 hypothetical protein SAMN04489712_10845 [Thermomonospora echinospora]